MNKFSVCTFYKSLRGSNGRFPWKSISCTMALEEYMVHNGSKRMLLSLCRQQHGLLTGDTFLKKDCFIGVACVSIVVKLWTIVNPL